MTRPTVSTPPDLPLFAPYTQAGVAECPDGHVYPRTAGECPHESHWTRAMYVRAAHLPAPGAQPESQQGGAVSPEIQAFMAASVIWKDNGRAPRSNYSYDQWDNAKAGTVNHIPVCDTLAQLTAYFNSGTAQGSTHFGNGRDYFATLTMFGFQFPCSEVHQYMSTSGPWAPWAQGIIDNSGNCAIPQAPIIATMASGEPNPAFVSIENVARSGADGVTDAQFNSNVCLRVYAAQYYQHAITPLTQLWHAEIDSANRCYDPGWPGALEDELQNAARALLRGDASLMRQAVAMSPVPPEPTPEPEPEPVPPDDTLLYLGVYQGMQEKLSTGFWHPDPATREHALTALYSDLGMIVTGG